MGKKIKGGGRESKPTQLYTTLGEGAAAGWVNDRNGNSNVRSRVFAAKEQKKEAKHLKESASINHNRQP